MMKPTALLGPALLVLFSLGPLPVRASPPGLPARSCASCHGELEFLRQHAANLADARLLRVTGDEVRASAHAGSACLECHSGFDRWPHPEGNEAGSCGACHQEEEEIFRANIHGRADQPGIESVGCSDCHSTHLVATVDSLRTGSGLLAMNARCVGCHETSAIDPSGPHGDTIACASCHPAHAAQDVDERDASVSPGNQADTCGACHEEAAAAWSEDAHGSALLAHEPVGLATLELEGHDAPPTCTTCHGSHDMRGTQAYQLMDQAAVCGECHEHALETFDDSYHGQATALGSVAVATCSDCHGAHGVFGEDDPRSLIHPDQLVESCGVCHEESRASFVLYQPHADHNDRERYPYVYWSYRLMTALLVGVFSVFGLHSALWIVRLTLDTLRRSPGGQA